MSNDVVLVEPPITRPTAGKRKSSGGLHEEIGEGLPAKKRPKKSGNSKSEPDANWPEYFQNLFKIFKSLNTVIAFCSSRKHLATTFSVIRSSVENIIKRPLDLREVAEIKALLPDLIRFAYIPADTLRINSNVTSTLKKRAHSPSFVLPGRSGFDEEEHVLVLDFVESTKKTKRADSENSWSMPASMTPQAVKKLIEQRNVSFVQAVNDLLQAYTNGEDPVGLVQQAARDHIPVNPKDRKREDPPAKNVPDVSSRPSILEVIGEIKQEEWYHDQIVEQRSFEAHEAEFEDLSTPLSSNIQNGLREARGITRFYSHQAAAINAVAAGKHVIVSTATASGKSVIYQVPMLRYLEEENQATAIYIYPTKALAQDQRFAMDQLLRKCPGLEEIQVFTYDGDTPKEKRLGIRERAAVIFTNFDMLHASILPHEEQWRKFLKNLRMVVVDELHYYSGTLGSHVAQIMRRLRRVCAAVGNRHVRYVSCSATIAQPLEHMRAIFGIEDIEVITQDGAPSGPRQFLIWTSPHLDPAQPNAGRTNPLTQTTTLMRYLMRRGVRTIVFCKIRKTCELVMKTLRQELSAEGRTDILQQVMAYRGGYSQEDRRRIEAEAFSGNLLGIVATNALELGVDIGNLDAVLVHGFPPTVASFRQQVGRAGRRSRDSLAVLVADNVGVDQHYVKHPEEVFTKPAEPLFVDLENRVILEAHLQCAAEEMPIHIEEDLAYFGSLLKSTCETRLRSDADGWYHTHPQLLPYPAKHVSIRGVKELKYAVIDVTRVPRGGVAEVLEEIEDSRVLFEAFEGAVFIHQGLTYLVQEVSHEMRVARVTRADVNWTTSPRDFTDVDAVRTYRIRELKGSPHRVYYGKIDIQTIVFGYFKLRHGQILDAIDLENPPYKRETVGFWLDVPRSTLELMREKGLNPAEAIHAAAHALMNRFDLGHELKTECKVPEKEYGKNAKENRRKRPARLTFYDPPGGGVSAKVFDYVSDLLHEAFEVIETCRCKNGCVRCVQSTACKESNEVCSKLGARVVLRGLLNLPTMIDAIPTNSEPTGNTIVAADPVKVAEGLQVEVELYAS